MLHLQAWQLVALESLVGLDAIDVVGLGNSFTDDSNDDEDEDDDDPDSDVTPNGSESGARRRLVSLGSTWPKFNVLELLKISKEMT